MELSVITDALSFLLLLFAYSLLWKERGRFYSLKPLLPALILLSLGRIGDISQEHPSPTVYQFLGMERETFVSVFAAAGNLMDVVGISFLIYGFLKIIKHIREERKHIQDLENLLPICSSCKKFRTEEGEWMPIEKYLIETGTKGLTHGICPDCVGKLYGDVGE